MWYGPTSDGTVPGPDDNIGRAPLGALAPKQLWFGLDRGDESLLDGGLDEIEATGAKRTRERRRDRGRVFSVERIEIQHVQGVARDLNDYHSNRHVVDRLACHARGKTFGHREVRAGIRCPRRWAICEGAAARTP